MKRLVLYSFVFILLSIGFYHATIFALPYVVYSKFQQKVETRNAKNVNEFSLIMAPDESSRLVVKPNPDFAYASAFFDVSEGPIKITGDMPDSTYWSVAMYEPSTINFYVKNDMEYKTNRLELILRHHDDASSIGVRSPVKNGFILIRLLIKERNEDIEKQMMSYLQTLKIELI